MGDYLCDVKVTHARALCLHGYYIINTAYHFQKKIKDDFEKKINDFRTS